MLRDCFGIGFLEAQYQLSSSDRLMLIERAIHEIADAMPDEELLTDPALDNEAGPFGVAPDDGLDG